MNDEPSDKDLDAMMSQIGRLVSQLGAYELILLSLVDMLTDEPELLDLARKMTISHRANLVKKLLKRRNIADVIVKAFDEIKVVAQKLSEQRDIVAHNTVTCTYATEAEPSSASFVVLRARSMVGALDPEDDPFYTLDQLLAAVGDAGALVKKAAKILDAVHKARRPKSRT